MNITTPKQKEKDLSKEVESAVNKFEDLLKSEPDGQIGYHLVISCEYNCAIRSEIVRLYTNAGWADVVCRTQTETEERPGLTDLILCREKL